MFVRVVALDYDGTVATNGRLDPNVREAIAEFRSSGGIVIFATGRILGDLETVAGDLRLVDAVVAENGAVVTLPAEGRVLTFGNEPPPALVAALTQRGIGHRTGRCVVESDAANAPEILQMVRGLELPQTLAFNRSRLMVLPAGISKATGLHEALRLLGRSEHNTLAIGDAENDHALLAACEHGVAVGWGTRSLMSVADEVLRGDGPDAVANYLRHLASSPATRTAPTTRRRLVLGTTATGSDITLAVQGRNTLIVGESQSGKSYIAGLLAEQLTLQRYAVYVIDPEGDYHSLASLPGVVAVGQSGLAHDRALLDELLGHPELSAVINLCGIDPAQKRATVTDLLSYLAVHRQRHGTPHRIFLDEAHYFANQLDLRSALNGEPTAYTLVTYRLEDLDQDIWAACPVLISTRLNEPTEVGALIDRAGLAGSTEHYVQLLGDLKVGEAVLLRGMDEGDGEPVRCRLAPRITEHVRHREKYVDVPVAASHAFVFTRDGAPTCDQARSLGEMVTLLSRVPAPVLAGHLRRNDISNWIGDVFGDHSLAAQVRAIETQTRSRQATETGVLLAQVIEDRYRP